MADIICIIPARSGSKRLHNKNMRLLSGKSLVHRAMEAAMQSKRIHHLILSSDSKAILDQARLVSERVMTLIRPAALATDESPAIDYVKHCIEWLRKSKDIQVSEVVIVQPSSPFTTGTDIDATLDVREVLGADCAVSVCEVPHHLHPAKFKRLQEGKLIPYFETENGRTAYHEMERIYVRNGSVYVSTLKLVDQGILLNDNCAAHIMPTSRSLDINDEMDWRFAEFMIQSSVSS